MRHENTERGMSNVVVAGVVLVAGVSLTMGTMALLGGARPVDGPSLDEVMEMADASQSEKAEPEGPRGQAIDSAPSEPSRPAAPGGGGGAISEEVFNKQNELLQQIEASKVNEEDLFKFDKTKDGLHYKVSFKALGGYEYEVPDPNVVRAQPDPTQAPEDQLPDGIKAIDDAPVLIAGFMVPIEFNADGKVRSFALTQDQLFCCYGVPPKMNEWVMVEMEDGYETEFRNDAPVAVYGSLDVGEEIDDGYVLSLYRMNSNKVIDVRELLKEVRG